MQQLDLKLLKNNINLWAKELGFAQIGITDTNLENEKSHLQNYLSKHFNAGMQYLERNQKLRLDPKELMPEAQSIICCRMNYLPSKKLLENPKNSIAIFAMRKNYSKLICERLEILAQKIQNALGDFAFKYRVFAGNAPILEKALAAKAGLGWIGKNTLLINQNDGSYFFLGEILVNIFLPIDQPAPNRCGICTKCLNSCPTKALVSSKVLDSNRCISYLTIEHKGEIPDDLKSLIGNKIFGCDDCQKCCPWNRFAKVNSAKEFLLNENFCNFTLDELFAWDEKEFLAKTSGTPIERIGFERWRRNLKNALKNCNN